MPNNASTDLPQRQVIDTTINALEKQLVDFLIDCNMITLNGQFSNDEDNLTVISTTEKSIVDYDFVKQCQNTQF